MNRRRSTLAVLVLVSLLLITVDFRAGGGGPLGSLQRGVFAVFAPIQDGFARIVRPVGGLFSTIGQLGQLRDQNQALRQENEDLRALRTSVADLQRRNEELRTLVGARERFELVTTAARVIAAPPSSFEWTVLIDVGANQGVAVGQAVVNAAGLVGRITEVTATRSRVLLASSPDARFVVRVAQNGNTGFLTGQGGRPMRLEMTESGAEVPLDAELVTQVFQGTSIPDGLPVGRLEPPDDGRTAGRRFLAVRPYVDFGKLGTVLVALNAPEEPVELPTEEQIDNPLAPRPDAPERTLDPDLQAAPEGIAPLPEPTVTAPVEPGPGGAAATASPS